MSFSKEQWYVDEAGGLCMGDQQIIHADEFCRDDEVGVGHANLSLVAAAPDLYKALKNLSMAAYAFGHEPQLQYEMNEALAAIKKAEGKK